MSIIRKIKEKVNQMTLLSDMWNIGFVTEEVTDVLKSDHLNIHWLKHNYTDRWFADPFLLDVTDNCIEVLVEEFCYKVGKGRIARLVINRLDYTLQEMKIVLEMPYHLSFPVIIRKDGQIFVMPECAKTGGINLYRYNPQDISFQQIGEVAHIPLADATIVEFNNKEKFMLGTKLPNPNGSELQIYPFDEMSMRIDPNPVANIKFKSNIARNAGDAFYIDDQMYRPSQDCNKCYGNGLNIQKVSKNGTDFTFETVKTFYSDDSEFDLGYHTFNMLNGLVVVDGHRYRFPRFVKTLKALLSPIR